MATTTLEPAVSLPDPAVGGSRVAERAAAIRRFRPLRFAGRLLRDVWGWVPVTPFGLAAIAALVWARSTFLGRDPDLVIATVVAAGTLLFAVLALIVLGTGLWLRLRPEPAPDELLDLEARIAVPSGWRPGFVRWNPLVVVRTGWESPAGVDVLDRSHDARGSETIVPGDRFRSDRIVRVATVTDLFGLARIRFRRTTRRPVRCLPWTGPPPSYPLVPQYQPGDLLGHPEGEPVGDLVEMRRYVAGDPLKLVLWKIYARTGRMLVRMPERSVSPTDRMLVHLVAAAGDDAAAGLVRGALEAGLLGRDVLFLAEGAALPAASLAEAEEQIVESVRFRATGGSSLEEFLVQGERRGVSAAWIFAPAVPGPWLERIRSVLDRHRGPFSAILGVDGPPRVHAVPRWQRWLWQPSGAEGPTADQVRHVRRILSQQGVTVRIIDRTTGQEVQID